MLIAIHAFAARLKAAGPDAVGFLYYSGHGIASAGENYLIRTDVALDGVAQRIGALGFHSSRKPADQNCIVMVIMLTQPIERVPGHPLWFVEAIAPGD